MPPDAQPSMSAVSCSIHNARIQTNVCLHLTAPLDDQVKHRTLVSPADILCGSAPYLHYLRNEWPVFIFGNKILCPLCSANAQAPSNLLSFLFMTPHVTSCWQNSVTSPRSLSLTSSLKFTVARHCTDRE